MHASARALTRCFFLRRVRCLLLFAMRHSALRRAMMMRSVTALLPVRVYATARPHALSHGACEQAAPPLRLFVARLPAFDSKAYISAIFFCAAVYPLLMLHYISFSRRFDIAIASRQLLAQEDDTGEALAGARCRRPYDGQARDAICLRRAAQDMMSRTMRATQQCAGAIKYADTSMILRATCHVMITL